mmetsp:Transcript_27728/g.79436  ORF Transcript_27728/g.79436 Transcript_27728/m.79436 type:complete len:349 (+) Transcript_27728:1201-2247(+)
MGLVGLVGLVRGIPQLDIFTALFKLFQSLFQLLVVLFELVNFFFGLHLAQGIQLCLVHRQVSTRVTLKNHLQFFLDCPQSIILLFWVESLKGLEQSHVSATAAGLGKNLIQVHKLLLGVPKRCNLNEILCPAPVEFFLQLVVLGGQGLLFVPQVPDHLTPAAPCDKDLEHVHGLDDMVDHRRAGTVTRLASQRDEVTKPRGLVHEHGEAPQDFAQEGSLPQVFGREVPRKDFLLRSLCDLGHGDAAEVFGLLLEPLYKLRFSHHLHEFLERSQRRRNVAARLLCKRCSKTFSANLSGALGLGAAAAAAVLRVIVFETGPILVLRGARGGTATIGGVGIGARIAVRAHL